MDQQRRKVDRFLLIKTFFLRPGNQVTVTNPTPSSIHHNRFNWLFEASEHVLCRAIRWNEAYAYARLTVLCQERKKQSSREKQREREREREERLVRRNRCVEKRTSARCKRHTRPSSRWRKRGGRVATSGFFDRRCIEKPPRGIRHFGAIKRSPTSYMHFVRPLLALRSRHLLCVHNSREIINNTCDDTRLERAWVPTATWNIHQRLRSRCKNLIDLEGESFLDLCCDRTRNFLSGYFCNMWLIVY